MSAFPNNKMHAVVASLLIGGTMPAAATIVVDTGVARARGGMLTETSLVSPYASSSAYVAARSRAWAKYQRGNPSTGRPLVGVPLNGAWMASSNSQYSARAHVARAQAYRLGERE